MRGKRALIIEGLAILISGLSLFLIATPVWGACAPPNDYGDCPSSPFGTNGVALMDSQYNPIETDFANLREIATQSNPESLYYRLQATIILTDGTIADIEKTKAIFMNAEKYGIDLTIRTWGNVMDLETTTQMGQNLAQSISYYKSVTGHDIKVELGNEPNLETSGSQYAQQFVAFAKACTGCSLFLPSMGGVPGDPSKQTFIKEFMANPEAKALANQATGIVFNSYGADPHQAVTDWINTLSLWQSVGVDTSRMVFFLTETGPPGGDFDTHNLDSFLAGIAQEFVKIKNDPTDPNHQLFQKLEGLTFFVWTKDERLILVYVDRKGRVIKRMSLKSANLPGKIPLANLRRKGGGLVRPLESYPEESEQKCMLWGKAPPESPPGEVPIYTKADGRPQQEMRTDASLNFDTGVLGLHCGQTKSQPISLKEIAYYDLFEVPKCKETWWMGEIQLNYGKKPEFNLDVPFAEEINDFLLGNLTAEFVSEREIEKTFADATSYNPVTFLTSFFNIFNTLGQARRKIDQRSGVLKKLTPWGEQNILKCNFINYVKLKGEESMYANFYVDGRRLTSIPCPPMASGDTNPLTNNFATNQLWFIQNSRTWSKLALFPNERSPGQLKFNVCADRQYILGENYPEVFRLGLGINQAFQTLSPSSAISMLYRNHPYDYSDLRNPLRSGPLVEGGFYSQDVSASPTFAQNSPRKTAISQPPSFARSLLFRLKEIAGEISDKMRAVALDRMVAVAASLPETGKRILAQAGLPGSPPPGQEITVTPELKLDEGKIDYRISIYVPVDGHVITELWIDNQKAGGTVNAVRAGGTLVYGTPGMAPAGAEIFPALTGNHEVKFLVKCDDCNIPQQGQEIWRSCSVTTLGGVSQTSCPLTIGQAIAQQPTCQPGVDCCAETPACHAPTCAICSRTQKGPSETTVWPLSYPADHVILGVNWLGLAAGTADGPTDDPVKFTFKIPDWKPGDPLPGDCHLENVCQPDDEKCKAAAEYCDPRTGKCGNIVCSKDHDRTIDVYNNVPFLASAWQQSAGSSFSNVPGGFLNIFRPSGIKGQGLLNQCGCTASENFVFDPLGHFAPNPGASEITAAFRNSFGFEPGKQFKHPDLEVFQTSPKETDPFKITYYRLGGLCNASKWVGQKALHPKRAAEPAPQCLGPGAYQPTTTLPPLKKQPRLPLSAWKRPLEDNGRCLHFLPRGTITAHTRCVQVVKSL